MAFFHVFLRGEHFLLEQAGKTAWMGFYKNIYTEAGSADEAGDIAVSRACADPGFRNSVRNPADNPPALNIEEVTEIAPDATLVDSAFVYFDDE